MRLALLLLALLASPVYAQNTRPEDSRRLSLFVVGEPNSAPASWFRDDTQLRAVAAATNFTILPPNGKLFRDRYAGRMQLGMQHVILERPDGGVIYSASGNQIPAAASSLYAALVESAKRAKEAQPAQLANYNPACPDGTCPLDCPDGVCPVPLNVNPTNEDFDFGLRVQHEGPFAKAANTFAWIIGGLIAVCVLGTGLLVAGGLVLVLLKFMR